MIQFGKRTGRRTPPVEYADAVEKWARARGRHASLVWSHRTRNWDVKITLNANDPRNVLDDATESVPLLKSGKINMVDGRPMPGLVGVELDELGVQGIIDILNETNLETGRFRSAEESMKHSADQHKADRAKEREFQRDEARHQGRDEYRRVMQHPLIQGADLVATDKVAAPQERQNGEA